MHRLGSISSAGTRQQYFGGWRSSGKVITGGRIERSSTKTEASLLSGGSHPLKLISQHVTTTSSSTTILTTAISMGIHSASALLSTTSVYLVMSGMLSLNERMHGPSSGSIGAIWMLLAVHLPSLQWIVMRQSKQQHL